MIHLGAKEYRDKGGKPGYGGLDVFPIARRPMMKRENMLFIPQCRCFCHAWRTAVKPMKPVLAKCFLLLFAATMLGSCASSGNHTDLYGEAVPEARAQHTIVIRPDTKHVNVEGGDTVRFIVGDKSFAWNFFIARKTDSFNLNDIAPPDILDHVVRVYVSPDPRYLGGSDRNE